MDRRKACEQQVRDVEELRTLLGGQNWIDAIPLFRPPRVKLEAGYRCSTYLGLLALLDGHSDPSEPAQPSAERLVHLVELVTRIEKMEFDVFVMGKPDAPNARSLQRSAQYARIAWPRSLFQQRAGLSVRAGLSEPLALDHVAHQDVWSPADERIRTFFDVSANVSGVSAAELVQALVALSAAFASCDYEVEQQTIIELVSTQGVRVELATGIASALTCRPDDVALFWNRHWRHKEMSDALVPHGPSAADLRPLIAFGSRYLVTNPRAFAMASERFVDELVLGRSESWPEMNMVGRDQADIVSARGQALERAAAAALGGSLRGQTVNPARLYVGVNFSATKTAPSEWSSDGEIDVLVGCGKFQIAVECKASAYNGTDIAPSELIGRPLKQIRAWRSARGQDVIRFAADNRGSEFPADARIELGGIASAPVAIEIIVPLDDFGLLPTAVPLAFQQGGALLEPDEAPIVVAFPDLWELCQVLTGADLLSYLAQRAQLTRSGIPHMFAEDGCLYSFLRTGQILNGRTVGLLEEAERDWEGLFAWKLQLQATDTPTVQAPRPHRIPELDGLLRGLNGPDAEVAHAIFATLQSADPRGEGELGAALAGRRGTNIAFNQTINALVVYGGEEDEYDTWPQTDLYLDALLDEFKADAKPRLVVSANTRTLPATIVVKGDPAVLVEPVQSKPLDLDRMLYDRARFDHVLSFKMPPYSTCPCGSGKKYKWCSPDHPPGMPRSRGEGRIGSGPAT